MKKTTLPAGMHDKVFKRALATYRFERTISDYLIEQGFHRIETPTLEHFEVFGDKVDKSHYQFFDQSGDLLSLRPDMTSQIGRVIASTRVHTPIKFSYSGKVFIHHEEMRGLANEQTQAGVEIIGYPAQDALLEALKSAKTALDLVGVDKCRFELSHAAILQTIFDRLNLSDKEKADLEVSLAEKNITKLNEFTKAHPSPFDDFIRQLPSLFGEMTSVLDRVRQLTDDVVLLGAFESLERIAKEVADVLPVLYCDLGQMASMPYYTGMMFKVFGDKVPDAFVSGGRYDKLFERFGAKELTAVGWAMDIDSIYQARHDDIDYEGGA